jgi:hypothetical protein
MDLELQIFLFIEFEQKFNGNKSGTSFAKIQNEFGITFKECREVLIKLYKEKKIKVREGINQKLVFL